MLAGIVAAATSDDGAETTANCAAASLSRLSRDEHEAVVEMVPRRSEPRAKRRRVTGNRPSCQTDIGCGAAECQLFGRCCYRKKFIKKRNAIARGLTSRALCEIAY